MLRLINAFQVKFDKPTLRPLFVIGLMVLMSSALLAQGAETVAAEESETEPAAEGKSVEIVDSEEKASSKQKRKDGDSEESNLYDFGNRYGVEKKKLPFEFDWSLSLLQEGHYYNNSDLRELDESSDKQIENSDDQTGLAFSKAKVDTRFYFPKERVNVDISWGFDGVWGHDQLQGYSNPGTRINRANVGWQFIRDWDLVVGRQYFAIGGISNDYMQKDILDAVVVNGRVPKIMTTKLLLFDAYSGASNFGSDDTERWNDEFQFFTRDDGEVTEAINGDVNTVRFGAVFSFAEAVRGLVDPRVYAYYAQIRGNGGGNDRTQNGELGNFSDGDTSMMFGGRLNYPIPLKEFQTFNVYADGAYSLGTDIQRKEEPDIDNAGLGAGGGAELKTKGKVALIGDLGFFFAQGAEYDSDGYKTQHGFTSMKGDEVGGLLFRRYWGVHPSAYVDDDGIDGRPFDANRKSGMMMIHVGFGVELNKMFLIRLDAWHMQDTGSTDVSNFERDEGESKPSPEEKRAQKKLGEAIGQEIDLTFEYKPNKLLTFRLNPAIFLPGEFYQDAITDKVSDNGGPKGGGQDAPFMGLAFGVEMKF